MAERRHDELGPDDVAVYRPADAGRDPDGIGYRGGQGLTRNLPPWARGAADRVGAFDPDELTTGQVLGIAVGAAAAVGGVVLALQPAPPLPAPVERAIGVLPEGQRRRARRAARQAEQRAQEVGERVEQAQHDLAAAAGAAVERASDVATTARENIGSAIAALGSTVAASGAALAAGEAGSTEEREAADEERRRAERAGRGRRRARQAREGAAAAGGALAGAGGAVARRIRGEHSAMDTVQERLEELTSGGRKATRRGKRDLRRQIKQLQKQTTRLQKEAGKRLPRRRRGPLDRLRGALPGRRSGPLDTVREGAADFGGSVGKTLAAAGAATAAATTPLFERARRGELTEQARERTADLTSQVRERTAELTERVREDVLPQVVDTATGVVSKVREEFVPQVADAASRTGARVGDTASKTGARVATLAASGLAAGRDALGNITGSDTVERAGELAERAGKQSRRQARAASKTARRGGSRAATAVGRAAGAAGNATKDTALIFVWAAALAGVVYYAFLNEEQRARVADTVRSIVEQGRELVRDFQGYDEEF